MKVIRGIKTTCELLYNDILNLVSEAYKKEYRYSISADGLCNLRNTKTIGFSVLMKISNYLKQLLDKHFKGTFESSVQLVKAPANGYLLIIVIKRDRV